MKPLIFVSALALFVGIMLAGCGLTSAPAPQPMSCPHQCTRDPLPYGQPAAMCLENPVNGRRVCYYDDPSEPGCRTALGRPGCDAEWNLLGQECQSADSE